MGTVTLTDGLRERKKREMRQRISDIATGMFLARGFDEVTVAEIAAAADVSEKTVYNYFPSKESLLLDREPRMVAMIRAAFGPGAEEPSPIRAAVGVLEADLEDLLGHWRDGPAAVGLREFRRFLEIVESTPSLRAAQQDMFARVVQVAATTLAERAGVDPEGPEPQVAAHALMGLWTVQFRALHRLARAGQTDLDVVRRDVTADVRRAARLLDTGLWAFGTMVTGATTRAQVQAAAELAGRHSRQVISALRESRRSWQLARRGRAD